MDQSGAPLAVSLSRDINTGQNQSDCTNCLKCLRIAHIIEGFRSDCQKRAHPAHNICLFYGTQMKLHLTCLTKCSKDTKTNLMSLASNSLGQTEPASHHLMVVYIILFK